MRTLPSEALPKLRKFRHSKSIMLSTRGPYTARVVNKLDRRWVFHFILFCSSNQQSQAVPIHTELDSKDTIKTSTTAHKPRTKAKIKTLCAIGLLKHTHTTKERKKTQKNNMIDLPWRNFQRFTDFTLVLRSVNAFILCGLRGTSVRCW